MASDRKEEKPGRVFARELYWFVTICLIGWIVAMAIVPPRARRYWAMLRLEAELAARNERIRERAEFLEQAAASLSADPQFREAWMRLVLDVRKDSEKFLKELRPSVR